MTTRRAIILGGAAAFFMAGCAREPHEPVTRDDVAALEQELLLLGPNVDPEEAARAAQMAYDVTADLKEEYQITDAPLVHNAKVNMGIKERGLCYHWARDMHSRIVQGRFATLQLDRLVANPGSVYALEHSTAVIFARGDSWKNGIILDPWREGGQLHWDQVRNDMENYKWQLRSDVTARRRAEGLPKTPATRGP